MKKEEVKERQKLRRKSKKRIKLEEQKEEVEGYFEEGGLEGKGGRKDWRRRDKKE